jgi:DNA repair protein RadC
LGDLTNVLSADLETLCKFDGVKSHSAVLLKLTDWIRTHHPVKGTRQPNQLQTHRKQATLFDHPLLDEAKLPKKKEKKSGPREDAVLRRRTGMFGKAVLKEAIELLPKLPNTESFDEVKEFLRNNLHFSAETTRQRNAAYILRRMFPEGYADRGLRLFAARYGDRQELRDVCFYRFCKAEPLMFDIMSDVLLPSIGHGRLRRDRLRSYIGHRFPSSKSILDYSQAIADALNASGVAKADRTRITFAYREILIPSFAFVIHSEFPEPGMYDISKLEANQAIRALLWNPDRVLPSLYQLRNLGIIAKVSEIDRVRQFTTKWRLEELVEHLIARGELE